MTVDPPPNPLISPNPSTSGLKISLHPLALLSISDYITRHTLRQNQGPIVGALLGSQEGREIAIEQAYEVLVNKTKVTDANKDGPGMGQEQELDIGIDEEWFDKKLQLFKDTHPTMDLLGWYSTTADPFFYPSQKHVYVHRLLQKYNESLVLLLINPFSAGATVGGKLPLGIFESIIEDADAHGLPGSSGGAPGPAGGSGGVLKFVPTKYTVETGEAEMIGVDFVAKGGWGNAAAVTEAPQTGRRKSSAALGAPSEEAPASSGADAVLGGEGASKDGDEAEYVGHQNDELIANLTAKANAIRMLHSRIRLLKAYLESLPTSQSANPNRDPNAETLPVSHPLLRSIKSLTHSRLPLIIPSDYAAFQQESLAEQSDVSLVALLGTLARSVDEMKELTRRFSIVDNATQRESNVIGGGMGSPSTPSSSQRSKDSGGGMMGVSLLGGFGGDLFDMRKMIRRSQ